MVESIPLGDEINASNAFDQTFNQIKHLLHKNKNLIYVDYHKFTNDSEYKGQMVFN